MAQVEATFELGTNGASIATTDVPSVDKWNATIFAGTLVYDNTHVAHGNLAMKSNTKAVGWNATALGTITDHYGRFYLWKPAAGEFVRVLSGGINGSQSVTFQLNASGFLISTSSTGSTMVTGAFDLRGAWIRVEYHLIHSATVGQVIVKTFLYDAITPMDNLTSTANFNTLASADTIRYGTIAASDIWMDDIVANATDFPGSAPNATTGSAHIATSRGVAW